jgi:glutathione synthase/RimK-type ligase-like ATP-grasp enzyme
VRVLVATCAGVDVDPDSPLLLGALDGAGLEARLAVWDDPDEDFDDALVVIRSTWDYAGRRAEFLAWAASIPRLANPYPIVEYSSDKRYLADLARRGFPVVASEFLDPGDAPRWPEGDLVVKPAVGAGSIDAARYGPGGHVDALAHVQRLHAVGRTVLVQPYVASVDAEGELAVVVVDGRVTHLMRKGALLNTPEPDRTRRYRFEQMSLAPRDAAAESLALAVVGDVGDLADEDLLYARVDLVRTGAGWAVLELELVEPSLFLTHFPPVAHRLAAAIAARVG